MSSKITAISPEKGGGARICRRKSGKPKYRHTTSARGGEPNYATEIKKTRNRAVLCHSRSSQNTRIAPGSEWGGIGRTKKKTKRKNDNPVPQLIGPITRTTARHRAGSVDRTEYAGTTPNPAQNSQNVSRATIERPDYADQHRH